MISLGLQLYTVKEEAAHDLAGTIRQVAAMGYDGVEFAGFHGTPLAEIKSVLEETGLSAAGTTHPTHELEADINRIVDNSKAIGCPTVVFPWLEERYRDSADAYKRAAETLNRYGEICRRSELAFLYHIHGYEFQSFDGENGLDLLMRYTDPQNVGLELDTYWVAHGGADQVALFRRYADRCPSLHLKDARDAEDWHDIEIGDGIIDFLTLLREASQNDVAWAIVEQERFEMPPLQSAGVSYRNARRLLEARD